MMPGDVRFKFSRKSPKYGQAASRKRKALHTIFVALGTILLIGGAPFAWKYQRTILRVLHLAPASEVAVEPVSEFARFKTLNDFQGVECIYTAKFVEAVPVLDEATSLNLMPMSRVVVQKILRESGDFDHPNSGGFKLYAITKGAKAMPTLENLNATPLDVLDTKVVLYPVVGNKDEVFELRLCPVIAYRKAQEMWLDRSFRYTGSQIGEIQIDPGSIVTVTDVQPAHFGLSGVAFNVAFRLPSGGIVHQTINPGNMGLLQPVDQ